MRRLNNNKELLIKLLKMFLAQHTNDIVLINDALAAGDRPQAIHLTHALKGTAGNLSANTVYQISSEFETTLRNTEPLPQSTPVSLVEAMAELTSTMKKLLNVTPDTKQQAAIPPQQVDRKQILQSLHSLKKLIEENDVSTEEKFTNDRAQIESLLTSATVESLAQALMIFDFAKADKLTTRLIEELTITV